MRHGQKLKKKKKKAIGIERSFGAGKEGKGVMLGRNGEDRFSGVDVMPSNKRKEGLGRSVKSRFP